MKELLFFSAASLLTTGICLYTIQKTNKIYNDLQLMENRQLMKWKEDRKDKIKNMLQWCNSNPLVRIFTVPEKF